MLTGKKAVLCMTGSIAAYKMADVASLLVKRRCDVHAVLTENAAKFIGPATFEALTKNPCRMDTFERGNPAEIPHLSLGQTADLMLVAPASADILGKIACGIADDLLTSTVIAATCPVLIAPAMNTHMYRNPIVQDNIRRLRSFGYEVAEPESGRLACGATGAGKLPEAAFLADLATRRMLEKESGQTECGLKGMRVLVTAGPTRESVDPVRFLTNRSSGKMGYAVAKEAARRGALVTLVTGPVSLAVPEGAQAVRIDTAEQMYQEVMKRAGEQDIIIKAAAVADYRPKQVHAEKIKKEDGGLTLEMERTKDILAELGRSKRDEQCVCGFSMETEHLLSNSRAKLQKKNADLIAANSLRESGAGFCADTNHLVLITKDGEEDLGICSKEACASRLLDRLYRIWEQKQKNRKK